MTNPQAFPLQPTPIHVPDRVLDDLRARLALTRAPLDEGNADWSYGFPDAPRAIRLTRRAARLAAGALERLERQRRRRRIHLFKGRPAHPRHDLLGEQLHRDVDALLRQRQPLSLRRTFH